MRGTARTASSARRRPWWRVSSIGDPGPVPATAGIFGRRPTPPAAAQSGSKRLSSSRYTIDVALRGDRGRGSGRGGSARSSKPRTCVSADRSPRALCSRAHVSSVDGVVDDEQLPVRVARPTHRLDRPLEQTRPGCASASPARPAGDSGTSTWRSHAVTSRDRTRAVRHRRAARIQTRRRGPADRRRDVLAVESDGRDLRSSAGASRRAARRTARRGTGADRRPQGYDRSGEDRSARRPAICVAPADASAGSRSAHARYRRRPAGTSTPSEAASVGATSITEIAPGRPTGSDAPPGGAGDRPDRDRRCATAGYGAVSTVRWPATTPCRSARRDPTRRAGRRADRRRYARSGRR